MVVVGAAGELAAPDGVYDGAPRELTATSAADATFQVFVASGGRWGWRLMLLLPARGATAPAGRSVGLLECREGFSAALQRHS